MAERKPRTAEQKARRKELDQARRAEKIAQAKAPPEEEKPPVPPLRVQRMGRNFRIVYEETRNLARYNSGEAVDDGGFTEEIDARVHLAKILGEQGPTADPEAETVGA
jgi:hypothetical protein